MKSTMPHTESGSSKAASQFERLISIMDELREKCPWDKKQTIESLRPQTIEETYELGDAILNQDWNNIKEELGDLLLHIVFYAKIASEEKKFVLAEVIDAVCNKLISRHPHIYSDVKVHNEEDVKRNWEQLKLREGKKSVLSGVPKGLPSVVKAQRIQEKAKQVGFEWDNRDDVFKKIEEELGELKEAIEENDTTHIEDEFGDVMFSLVNYSRFIGVDAEAALERTNKKFISRFQQMEELAAEEGKQLAQLTLADMDTMWNRVKKNTR